MSRSMSPFSAASIAKPITLPAPMVSRLSSSHILLRVATCFRSPMPMLEPSIATFS